MFTITLIAILKRMGYAPKTNAALDMRDVTAWAVGMPNIDAA